MFVYILKDKKENPVWSLKNIKYIQSNFARSNTIKDGSNWFEIPINFP